jgi:hypothetical protein
MTFLSRSLDKLRRRLHLRMLRTAPRTEYAGIEVVDWNVSSPERRDQIYRTVTTALREIESAFPLGFRRIQRSIRRVIVEYLPGVHGVYCREREAAVVSADVVLNEGPWQTALTVIHEATHAQMEARGIEYKQEHRKQIERICRKRERAFIRRFQGEPGVAEWLSYIEAKLDRDGLSDAELRQGHRERLILHMKKYGAPRFLLRFCEARISAPTPERTEG